MSTLTVPLWRKTQRENFTRIGPLLDFLEISQEGRGRIWQSPTFACNVPRRLAEKMDKGNLEDPLFLQFVPLQKEQIKTFGFVQDPVQDQTFCKTGKLLQKYKGRALLLVTSACAMHCRYCFRQNFPYETDVAGFGEEIALIANDPSIREVILSGGDPLSLSDVALEQLLSALSEILHVKRIRFHTRFPIGIPERIDEAFLAMLSRVKKQIVFVIHSNHPKELDVDLLNRLQNLLELKIPVLNQSVLLRGVNDQKEVLLELCQTLIDYGIIPYYLHQLDPVQGASHFAVSDEKAFELVRFLQENLSGYGVPRLVREEPGFLHKTALRSSK